MTFSLNELTAIYSEQIWVELSSEKKEKAWQLTCSQPYSNAGSQRNAYLNNLCLDAFECWLKEDSDLYQGYQLFCPKTELPYSWEILNGTGFSLGGKRLYLIACEKSCIQQFTIQQEWVDILNMAANYYVAVQINLAESWLRIWGYASYEQIREQARYDPLDRAYVLDGEDLITDLNVMWVSCLSSENRILDINSLSLVPDLANLSPTQTEELLVSLSKPTAYSPRLNISFAEWAAIIASEENRQKLYQQRILSSQTKSRCPWQPLKVVSQLVEFDTRKESTLDVNNLSQWFENIFHNAWQSIEMLLNLDETTLAVSFRNNSGFNEIRVTGAKVIDLGMQVEGKSVVLLVALTPEDDEKVSIRVQLHPTSDNIYLPSNLKLVLISQSGKILQESQSRAHDNYIQLKRFKSTYGNRFSIQVALNDVSVREEFLLEKPVG
jgi:Protein of unknown function (DUF1822)